MDTNTVNRRKISEPAKCVNTMQALTNQRRNRIMATAILNAARLRELLSYDASTGIFKNRITRNGRAIAGQVVGSRHSDGYLTVMLEGKNHLAHRLAWLHTHGEFPIGQIDHINRNKSDNRIANLRDVSRSKNQQNKTEASSNNKTGFLGVVSHKGKFRAVIKAGGKRTYGGSFDTAELASEAYQRIKQIVHPGAII